MRPKGNPRRGSCIRTQRAGALALRRLVGGSAQFHGRLNVALRRVHFAREVSMQFLEDITHPLAVGAAAESPAEAAVRRGSHWVALPDEHDLIAPLARLVTARDGHRVVPFLHRSWSRRSSNTSSAQGNLLNV